MVTTQQFLFFGSMRFTDTWNGATHSRGRWHLFAPGSEHAFAVIADSEDRELVSKHFESRESPEDRMASALAVAQRHWPGATRVEIGEWGLDVYGLKGATQ
jgi:hypothetical protein